MKSTYAIKDFWKETYKTDSPIPFIISAQVIVFLVIHFFKLLFDIELINVNIYDWALQKISLPSSIDQFIKQPWSIITYPLLYSSIFNLLFDCLWLYFVGNSFLNLLNRRQFLTAYIGGMLLGGLLFMSFNQLRIFSGSETLYSAALPLAAILSATATLIPRSEVRLFLLGNVKIYLLISIYLGIQLIQFFLHSTSIGLSYLLVILYGFIFMISLKKGNDWSQIFSKKEKRKLKIVHQSPNKKYHNKSAVVSNQELIDGILDKISAHGYESLTSQEKETLFKASKED